jgi:hypothetical protein
MSTLQKEYMEVANVFHWATRDDYVLWFTGTTGRDRRTERILPQLVKKGRLFSARYGSRLIYTTPERMQLLSKVAPYNDPQTNKAGVHLLQPYHGLSCTRCLVRFVRSYRNCEVIPEKFYRASRMGVVPEWGIRYPTGKTLLFEFSTADQVMRNGVVAGKIVRYQKALLASAFILFVLDVTPAVVSSIVGDLKPGSDFYFTDYQSFLDVPMGRQLSAPIYLSGADCQPCALGRNEQKL